MLDDGKSSCDGCLLTDQCSADAHQIDRSQGVSLPSIGSLQTRSEQSRLKEQVPIFRLTFSGARLSRRVLG